MATTVITTNISNSGTYTGAGNVYTVPAGSYAILTFIRIVSSTTEIQDGGGNTVQSFSSSAQFLGGYYLCAGQAVHNSGGSNVLGIVEFSNT